MDTTQKLAKYTLIGSVFSAAPVDRKTLFAGRTDQLRDALTAVTQKARHAVIYGERGVGKTSLANIVLEVFGDQINKPECGPINCDETMTFSDLWHTVFREMHVNGDKTLSQLAPKEIRPDDVRHVLQNISKTVIVLDEFDRIADPKITIRMADAIKNLSDHGVDTTMILVGVADSVDALLAEHVSIERNLAQIPMPRMSDVELGEIIDKRAALCSMSITAEAKVRIITLSQGLPHYTHVLCLNAFQDAVTRDSETVSVDDCRTAIDRSLKGATQSVISAYHKAVASPRKDNLYAQVLLACAMTPTDPLGYFFAGDVRSPMSTIMKADYDIPAFSQHLKAFCDVARGPILRRDGERRRYRYRFANPLLQPHVIMHGVTSGLIQQNQIPRRMA
jgi:Cdc6-like AAA superfamily ATPase